MSTIERLKDLDAGYRASRAVYSAYQIFTGDEIDEVFEQLPKLLAVVEAAEAVLDEADPRKYGDMTAKQSNLADKLVALHENSATE